MKNYSKAEMQIISFVSKSAIAGVVPIEDWLAGNGRNPDDVIGGIVTGGATGGGSTSGSIGESGSFSPAS